PAPEIATEEPALQVDQFGHSVLYPERRLDLGDLLTQEHHALQPDQALDPYPQPVGPTLDLPELTLDVFQWDARVDLVIVQHNASVVPGAPCGLVGDARPADPQVAPRREGPAVVQPVGELRHQRRHLLPQIGVEPEPLDPEFADTQVESPG